MEREWELTYTRGLRHEYLSMTYDFESVPGKVVISQHKFAQEILAALPVKGKAASPASSHLFNISESEALKTVDADKYRSIVAKVLYYAKHAAPETLTATSFLLSRAQSPTLQDWAKLIRLMKYINANPKRSIVLATNAKPSVKAYIDASFAVHPDCKSHSGCIISLGEGPIYVKSRKQKAVFGKSSTETELIAVTDNLPQVIWTREFLQGLGFEQGPATIYQDNKSTMALIANGKSNSGSTRHINVRYFFVKDRVDAGEVKVEHLGTKHMVADILTKPLQGQLFRTFREQLCNA